MLIEPREKDMRDREPSPLVRSLSKGTNPILKAERAELCLECGEVVTISGPYSSSLFAGHGFRYGETWLPP